MKLRDVVSFLAFGVIVAFVLGYLSTLGLRVAPPSDRTTLTMEVPEINGLVAGSNVLLRGVPVGKVTGTVAAVDSASVSFYVDGKYRIPVDTEVRLENLSALGESYVALYPRSDGGPQFRDGQVISTDAVVQPPSITELAASVTRVLDQADPGALTRIIDETDTALPDPVTVLPNVTRAITMLNDTVQGMNGRGRILLDNFQALISNAAWAGPTLTTLVPKVLEVGANIQEFYKHAPVLIHRGEPNNVSNLNKLLARIQGLLDDRGPDLKVLGEAFQPKLSAIAGALMNLDTGQLLDGFLESVPPDGTVTLHVKP